MPAAIIDKITVDMMGREISRPNTVKVKSPGKRPIPNRRKNGISPEKSASAITVAISHLIIDRLSHRPCCSGARSKQSLHEH
jgi:hypothetical protein